MTRDSSVRPVGIAVVGAGVMGREYLIAGGDSNLLDIRGVYDAVEASSRAAAREVETRSYESIDAVLRDPSVEAVILATPPAVRKELAGQVLKHGKHVLLEKPATLSSTETRWLLERSDGLVAACCVGRFRCLESSRVVAQTLADGVLGSIRSMTCHAFAALPAKMSPFMFHRKENGGGMMVNLGCYDLDYLLGSLAWKPQPVRVWAKWWGVPHASLAHVPPDTDVEAQVVAMIELSDGSVLSLDRGNYMPTTMTNQWTFVGELGLLHSDLMPGNYYQPGASFDVEGVHREVTLDVGNASGGVASIAVWSGLETFRDAHRAVVEDFALAVRTGAEPATSLEHALDVQVLIEAIYRSALSGQPIELDYAGT